MTIRRIRTGVILGITSMLLVGGVAWAQDTPTYTNADFQRLPQPGSPEPATGASPQAGGQAFTNADLGNLPQPGNSELPVAEEEEGEAKAAPAPAAKAAATEGAEDTSKWLDRTLADMKRQTRVDRLQRRIRTLSERIETLDTTDRAKGDIGNATDTNRLVTRGVGDAETPRRMERRRLAAELARARVELAEVLAEGD